jgi:hypothetical protein
VVARIALIVLAGVLLGGCYASTEPATNVGPESATLNARGTANNGPARSHFEFWITGSARVRRTDDRHWPAGASGPFSERAAGLAAATSYSFRLCGADGAVDGTYVCGQTRSFKTGAPTQDSAVGFWGGSPHYYGGVSAHSSRSGGSPQGSMSFRVSFDYFEGSVSCLRVSGNRAAVGAVGSRYDQLQQPHPATALITIVDGGATADDKLDVGGIQDGSTPPDCAAATFGQEGPIQFAPYLNELVVNDAP